MPGNSVVPRVAQLWLLEAMRAQAGRKGRRPSSVRRDRPWNAHGIERISIGQRSR